jgi:hypothetical protein
MEYTQHITKPQLISGRYPVEPDNVLKSFNATFLDEAACRTWILKGLHGDNAHCPGCGIIILDAKRLQHFWFGERLTCQDQPRCKKHFTALTETFFTHCHMTFSEMFLMMFLLGAGFKDRLIAEKLKISQESVRLWRLKFKAMEIANQYE